MISVAAFLTGAGVAEMVANLPLVIGLLSVFAGLSLFYYLAIKHWPAPKQTWSLIVGVGLIGTLIFSAWQLYFAPRELERLVTRKWGIVRSNQAAGCNDLGRKEALEFLSSVGEQLTELDLDCAEVRGLNIAPRTLMHDLEMARANARETVFAEVNLVSSILSATNFEDANFSGANLRYAILGRHWLREKKAGDGECYAGANVKNAKFDGADLEMAYLVGIRGMTCAQLMEAKNWWLAVRSEALSCGKTIPSSRKYAYVNKWPERCVDGYE